MTTTIDWTHILTPPFRFSPIIQPHIKQVPARPSTPVPGDQNHEYKSSEDTCSTIYDNISAVLQRKTPASHPPGLRLERPNPFNMVYFLKLCSQVFNSTEDGLAPVIVDEVIASLMAKGAAVPDEREKALAISVISTKYIFRERARALTLSALNTRPKMRPGFMKMVWMVVISSQELDQGTKQPRAAALIPMIRPVQEVFPFAGLTFDTVSDNIEQKLDEVEYLLRYYPLPSSIISPLAELANDINNNLFARYMISRGRYPPRTSDTREKALLRFWESTSSESINEFLKKLATERKPMSRFDKFYRRAIPPPGEREIRLAERLRVVLRREARRVLGPCSDEELDKVIRKGVEEVATLRRRMMVILKTEYERLLEQAKSLDPFVQNYPGPPDVIRPKKKRTSMNHIVDSAGNGLGLLGGTVYQLSSENLEMLDWEDCY